nr:hypothetical protein BaRGS_033176 [Batillaria attramentaria]
MDLDKGVAKTVMYYNRGDSFGELAIMNNSRRQSTVISKENMQLLVLSDTDFIEVFMSGGLKDPEDPFLSSLSCLDGWPKEKLAENPKKALYSYFKRGTILVPDSLNNDWIIIVKSCQSAEETEGRERAEAIKQRAAKSFQEKLQELAEEEAEGETTHEERVQNVYEARQEILEKVGHLERFYALPEIFVDTNDEYNEMKRLHDEFTELHGTNLLHGRDLTTHTPMSDHQLSRAVTNASLSRQGTGTSLDHQKLGALVKKGPFMAKSRQNGTPSKENTALESRKNTSLSALFRHDTQSANMIDTKPTKTPAPPMFVNVQTLTKGMVFGLADIFFDNQPAMALVSNGAECISISKKLFMEHASHAFVTRIREDIYPYPSEEDLQENLEAQICWDFHRRDVMTHVVHDLVWKRADKNDARFNISPALGY